MNNVHVVDGDIIWDVQVDAIATLINSEGDWFGAVDEAIKRVAGESFHSQVLEILEEDELYDNDVIITSKKTKNGLYFKHVIFIVDEKIQPLHNLVWTAFESAQEEEYESVAIPLMRTGKAKGLVEKTVSDVVKEIAIAVKGYLAENDGDMKIYIVVYNDPIAFKELKTLLEEE